MNFPENESGETASKFRIKKVSYCVNVLNKTFYQDISCGMSAATEKSYTKTCDPRPELLFCVFLTFFDDLVEWIEVALSPYYSH